MLVARFDFYEVRTGDTALTLQQVLDDLLSREATERTCDIDGKVCCVIERLSQLNYIAYLFSKVRMDDLPQRTKLDGSRAPLELDEDEGLGEDVAMALDATLNIVAIQRNRHSMTPNNIARLINFFYPEIQISFVPILSRDALERFARCDTLRKLRIKLSGTSNCDFLNTNDLSANEKITMQEILSEPYVDITFSVGRKNMSLTGKIRRLAEFFSNFYRNGGGETVLAIDVTGKENDDTPSMMIDLLSEKLTFEHDVEQDGRTINTNHLLRVACAAIATNAVELASRNVD
jgi:hypothetical protein